MDVSARSLTPFVILLGLAACGSVPPGSTDPVDCFYDGDEDGFGYTTVTSDPDGSCEDDPRQAAESGDCDDSRADFHPGALDPADDGFDQDCSGTDSRTCYIDADDDGWGAEETVVDPDGDCVDVGQAEVSDDCDDADGTIHPDAAELSGDGIDQDCDGSDSLDCYYDGDGDGYGYTTTTPDSDGDCDDDAYQTSVPGDCDDSRGAIHPGATEIVDDTLDQDCNGADAIPCWADADEDGFGAGASFVEADGACGEAGVGATSDGDCDDGDDTIYPFAEELPDDSIDQDCDGLDAALCFYDGDNDGYGWSGTSVELDGDCEDDPWDALVSGDCNDALATIHPGAQEVVGNGLDEDCSGADTVACFADGDGDEWGAGSALSILGTCDLPGVAALGGDCDDEAPSVHPTALELLGDGIDQDCSGTDAVTCFYDGDGDGFGWSGTVIEADGSCLDSPHDSPLDSDCNDSLASVYPGAPVIVGDGVDQDCSGTAE